MEEESSNKKEKTHILLWNQTHYIAVSKLSDISRFGHNSAPWTSAINEVVLNVTTSYYLFFFLFSSYSVVALEDSSMIGYLCHHMFVAVFLMKLLSSKLKLGSYIVLYGFPYFGNPSLQFSLDFLLDAIWH